MDIGVVQQLLCMRQNQVNKGIEQYVRSVHIQLATVIGLHILVLGYFYPFAVITSIFVPATYFINPNGEIAVSLFRPQTKDSLNTIYIELKNTI